MSQEHDAEWDRIMSALFEAREAAEKLAESRKRYFKAPGIDLRLSYDWRDRYRSEGALQAGWKLDNCSERGGIGDLMAGPHWPALREWVEAVRRHVAGEGPLPDSFEISAEPWATS